MKTFTQILSIIILLTLGTSISYAQAPTCDATVPFYTVNLMGQPAGSWESPSFSRIGHCCTATGSDNCASFLLVMDSNAAMVNFTIASGAIPSGVMYYQVDCNTPVMVGSPICISGGTHYLTFCKPGNNENTYAITSIPKPAFPRDDSARIGCSRLLAFRGLSAGSITWTSIYPGASGTYNSNLTMNDSTHLRYTPSAGAPPYVDYRMCGNPQATICGFFSYCDTVRVYNFSALAGTSSPGSPSFCAGGTGVVVTASASGGAAPYSYIWKNSSGTTVGTSAAYTASVAGTYTIESRDALYNTSLCPGFAHTVNVTSALTPVVNAGPDQIICASSPLTHLSGSIAYATGSTWTGGAGTFSAGATSLVTDYTPTAGELSAGYVNLILTSAGAGGGCINKSDTVHITYSPLVNVSMTANHVSCNGGNNGSVTAAPNSGTSPFTYSWSTSPEQTTSIATGLPAGTYTVTVTDAHSCTRTATATITQPTLLAATANTLSNALCNGINNGSVSVTPSGGTTPYTYSWSTSPVRTTATATGLPAGTYTITVTDAHNCLVTDTTTVTQPSTLAATASTLTNVSCNGGNNGSVSVSASGGTTPYTYSWNTSPVQTTATATGLPSRTYIVTVSDANNCSMTATATVTQPTVLNATTATLTNVACNGGNDGSVSVTPQGGTSPYTYSWNTSPIQTTATATSLPIGTYIVTVTDAHNCARTATATVTQPTALGATASTLTNVACNGGNNGSVRVTPSGGTSPYTYNWNTSPAQTTATATGLIAGTYMVTVTDAHNCIKTATATVTEPTALAATASTLTDVACNGGNNGSVTVAPSGGTSPYTYSWNTSPVKTTATATGLPVGGYTVTVTDAHNCVTTAAATITEPTALAATASTLTDVSCNGGNNGSVSVTPAGGTSPYTYNWNTSPAQTTAAATGLPIGTYIVTVRDAHNCATTATAAVTQPTALSAIASTQTNVACNGGNDGSASVTPTGGTSPYTYSWNTSPLQTTAAATGFPAGTYTVTVTDAHNCITTAIATVTQPISLTATANTISNALCNGINTGSVNVNPSGGTTPYTYTWNTSPIQTTATASGLPAGIYTATVRDAHNCSVTATTIVTQPSTLAITTSTLNNVSCKGGNNGSVVVTPTGGTTPYTYSWNTAPAQTTATAIGLPAGTYTVTVTDDHNCSVTASATVTEPTVLAATTSTQANVSCNGGNNGSVTVVPEGGTIPYSYSWSTAPIQTDATAIGLTAGTYTVTVTDEHGCFVNVDATVTEPEQLSVSAAGDNILCNGGTTIINVAAAGGTTPYDGIGQFTRGAGIYGFMVTDVNGCTAVTSITIAEPDALSLTSSSTDVGCDAISHGSATIVAFGGTAPYTYQWDANTKDQLTPTATSLTKGAYDVIVTDQHGCAKEATVNVYGQLSPLELTSVATPAACYDGNSGSISVYTTGGTPPYTYIWSNGYIGMNLSGVAAGQYSISVTDSVGCTTNATYTVTQPTPVQVNLTAMVYPTGFNVSTYNGSDGTVKTEASGGTAPYTYLWSNGNSGAELVDVPAGEYTVTVTDNNGCIDTASVILVEPNVLELPTGYSPNDDGKNDLFVIHGIKAYPNNHFVVFNRWGNEVYSADGYHNTWNGKNKDGKDLPDGTYFVVLTVNGGAITRKGYVDLRR